MVVDTSAVVAILRGEPEGDVFQQKIDAADVRLLSAANLVECSIVVGNRFGQPGLDHLDLFIEAAGLEIVPVDREQALAARQAYRRFSKGLHPAGLNFGDCFAYALSQTSGEPLLFKGNDFHHTDVAAA